MTDRYQYRDERGLRRSITEHVQLPTPTLYVEGSMCQRTGVAGWGAVFCNGTGGELAPSGPLVGDYGGSATRMELAAAQEAFQAVMGRTGIREHLMLSMRSTAALAVLRWVFPDAPFVGELDVRPPKKLSRAMKDFQPIYDLHDHVEHTGVRLILAHVPATRLTDLASEGAKLQMMQRRNSWRPL